MRVPSPLTSMLYFQMVIMAGTVMLAYYFEYTDTFTVNVQGFFCYEGAYRKPYPGPEDRSAVPPVLLYSLTAGVPVLVVSRGRPCRTPLTCWAGPGRAGRAAGPGRSSAAGGGLRPGPAGGDPPRCRDCGPAPGPGGQRCRPSPCPTVPTAPLKFIFSTGLCNCQCLYFQPRATPFGKELSFLFRNARRLQIDGQPEENPVYSYHLLMCHPVLIRKSLCQFCFLKVNWYVQGAGSSFT